MPTICLYEVERSILKNLGRDGARAARERMLIGRLIPLHAEIAWRAAELSVQHKLPLADAIINATAPRYDAELWTQDKHLEELPGVRYFPKLELKDGLLGQARSTSFRG